MSRSRDFVRSLLGPHVLFAFAVGFIEGSGRTASLDSGPAYPVPRFIAAVVGEDPSRGTFAFALALGLAAAAAAFLARRLTGNTLASACAGALFVLHPAMREDLRLSLSGGGPSLTTGTLGEILAATLGLMAAGVRLLPSPVLARQPLVGKREILALALVLTGAFCGPGILAAPFLILLADMAFAPASLGLILRRTGILSVAQLGAASVSLLFAADYWKGLDAWQLGPGAWFRSALLVPGAPLMDAFPAIVTLVAASLVLLLLRERIHKTIPNAVAFAIVCAALVAVYSRQPPLISLFGVALLVPTILWRIAIAVTTPRGAEAAAEQPLPSVPALRDLIRRMRAEPRPAVAPAASAAASRGTATDAAGVRTTVERAVAGAVAATLEQIRLAFRGPHVTQPPGTAEQALWERLMTQAPGGGESQERAAAAAGRWHEFRAKHLDPRIRAAGIVVCAGATPWPLAASLGQSRHRVIVVERTPRTAEIASDDLAGAAGVTVVRDDGRELKSIGDSTVDAVVALFEPTVATSAELLTLIKECKRVLTKGGVAGIAFADLARPESREALARGSAATFFTNREALEVLARFAGFGKVETGPGALAWTSIAWMTA